MNLDNNNVIINYMKKPQFTQDQIYHIYNRGVEKRKIFLDKQDYLRFIHNLFTLNNENIITNNSYDFSNKLNKNESKSRKLLVEILAFTLMPNHFHLLLRQKENNGIVKFMQKLGTGYSMYFNQKNKRVGGLFQGRFKAVIIDNDAHFWHIPTYIHLNPLSLINYRGSTSINYKQKIEFLKQYKWSSFLDYIGEKNFPSVISKDFLLDVFQGEKNYMKITADWIKNDSKYLQKINDITLK